MTTERRNQPRTQLRVPLYLLLEGESNPIRTETEDLSMEGFYCYVERPFSPGQTLKFMMFLPPATKSSLALGGLCLQGSVQVVRLTVTGDLRYGLGCHLVSYRVLPHPESLTSDHILPLLSENNHKECRSFDVGQRATVFPVPRES